MKYAALCLLLCSWLLGHAQKPVTIQRTEKGLWVHVKGKPVFFYHTDVAMPPAGSPLYYKRSGFIHPLLTPAGDTLTDDFPAGHAHQHGIFLAWVNTTFRNKKTDFWNQHQQTGTVEHVRVLETDEKRNYARIKTLLRHISLEFGPVIEETWTITVYPQDSAFMFDLVSEQVNITGDTLYLNKYHYGGMAFRGSRRWNSHDREHFSNSWQLVTSEGKTNAEANHTRARWVDASGRLANGTGGVTVIGHPSNFRYPQTIRVHPDMPYWVFAPVADDGFTLAPGQLYRSTFRYIVHNGTANPPAIEISAAKWNKKY